MNEIIRKVDPEIAEAIRMELNRQRNTLELIASENFASLAVLEAQGSVLTNKYAEGYPAKRYYGGCDFVDIAEDLARKRVKLLFGAEHANIQPHSGSQANMAVYFTILKPGDTVMGLELSHGGHLTTGSPVNLSGQLYNFVPYGVSKETEEFDHEEILSIAKKCQPKLIIAGGSAYPRKIDFARFREIANEVGAMFMVDMAHIAGIIAAGLHPNPVSVAEFVTSTTHKTLRGPRGGMILCKSDFAFAIDKTIFPGIQGGPLMHVIAAKAVAFREASTEEFKEYQRQIVKNAFALAETLKQNGFRLVAGGTDTHLLLVDLTKNNITGLEAQNALDVVGITVNRNTIPFETKSPFVTSGIRLGTPSLTTRGMKESEMEKIGNLIAKVLDNLENAKIYKEVKKEVKRLCEEFPLYPELEEN